MPRKRRPRPRPRGSGSVSYDKAKARWVARLPASLDPARARRFFPTEAEARRHLERELERLARDANADASEPLGAFLLRWHALTRHRWSAGTTRVNDVRINQVPDAIARIPLRDLRPDHLQAVMASLQARGIAPSYQRAVRGLLRSALRYALRIGLLDRDVTAEMDASPPDQAELVVWDEMDVARFLRAERSHPLHDAWRLVVGTGLRGGELRALRWEDIDPRTGVLTVRRGLSQNKATIQPTKSRRVRRIDLPPLLLAMLVRRRETVRGEWVFPSPRGGPYSWSGVHSAFVRAVARFNAGAPAASRLPELKLHGLRHTYASLQLSKGVPIATVAAILGHANPSITLSIYSHVVRGDQRRAAEIAAEWLSLDAEIDHLDTDLSTDPPESRTNGGQS